MNINSFDFHNNSNNSTLNPNISPDNIVNNTGNIDPINNAIKDLENNLCDMKVNLAETKAALLFLAQTLCSKGNLCSTEKTLLLSIEQSLKSLNIKINESRVDVECLSCLLR